VRRKKTNLPAVLAIGFSVVAIAALCGGILWVLGFLGSPQAARLLEQAVGSAFQAEAKILGLRAEGIGAAADRLELRGMPESPIDSLHAESLFAPCNWRALLQGNLHLHEIGAGRVVVSFKDPIAQETIIEAQISDASNERFHIGRFSLRSADISYKGFNLSGVAVTAAQFGDSWNIVGSGGELFIPGIPKLDVSKIELRESGGVFTLDSSSFRLGSGLVSATGTSAAPAALDAKFQDVLPSELIPGLPAGRLRGLASGSVQLRVNEPLRGSFSVSNALLADLPLLKNISDFLGDRSFLEIPFQNFSADFEFNDGVWHLSNINLASGGKLAARGSVRIGADGQLSGQLQLGVANRILSALPGARETVFREEKDDFWWAPLALGGTVAHPTEDLSRKLTASIAGGLLIKHGTNAVEAVPETAVDAAKGVFDLLSPLIP